MLVNALYNVVDRIFLGQVVGSNAIGGVYLAFPFMIVAMAFAMLIGFGGNALSSIELGRGNRENPKRFSITRSSCSSLRGSRSPFS